MKLFKVNSHFDPDPYLRQPIEDDSLLTLPFKHFDKDGYEVPTTLERMYYEQSGIKLNREIQYHVAPVWEWYRDAEDSEQELVLDHCMLLTRYAIGGNARKQLHNAAKQRPILNKLLKIKPKWGLDFSLDYITHDVCMEVIHIEQDFDNIYQANKAKERLEKIIENTDWLQGAHDLIKRRDRWCDLNSDDQSDYKAKHFGIHRAFDNKKVMNG